MSRVSIFTDGGARGNPGPAALGVYVEDEGKKELARIGKWIGDTTNNVAEYSAILEGMNWAVGNKDKHKIQSINFFMDSQLAYSQLTGFYKIKNDKIRQLILKIRQKEAVLGIPIFYRHIPREKNKKADFMVNFALDKRLVGD